jgi:HSP20 family protein
MLVHWTPWTTLSEVDRLAQSLAGRRGHRFAPLGTKGDSEGAQPWRPAVDIHEDGERFWLFTDLPGLDQNDVEISIEKNVLSVRGERKAAQPQGANTTLSERAVGRFTRSFTLPELVDVDRVTAEMKSGVLTVTLPKKAEAKPRQIKVATASS